MDFDFNAPAQQAPGDPFALPQQSPESVPKKKRSKCNLEHVVVYSFFIILKPASPVLVLVMLVTKLGVVELLPPATLLTVMDEWFTHHIAGRRMVRLRYHIYGVDGKSYTHYEFDTQTKANKCEAITFWAFLWVLPLFWVVILIIIMVSSTIKILTLSFNPTIIVYAIAQGIFSCLSIYKFMMTRAARSAKIREEKKMGRTAPASIPAPQNNDYTAPQPQQQPDQFVF